MNRLILINTYFDFVSKNHMIMIDITVWI